MIEFNAEEFLDSLKEEEGTESVDKAFAALSAQLPEPQYKAAVTAVEKTIFQEVAEWIEKDGVAEVKRQIRERAKADADDPHVVSLAQTLAQIMLQISKAKGDEASPLVKAFSPRARCFRSLRLPRVFSDSFERT
jgi:hypothetical protein